VEAVDVLHENRVTPSTPNRLDEFFDLHLDWFQIPLELVEFADLPVKFSKESVRSKISHRSCRIFELIDGRLNGRV
ncbi:uncharacterized protein METZ01_LOCUS318949, partial [marine metagenome]